MKNRAAILSILFLSLAISFNSFAQTNGISLNTPDATEGYTLFDEGTTAYLIDNCGGVVNTWDVGFSAYQPKLLNNGNLLYLERTGIVEKDWDDNIINEIFHGDAQLSLRYEVVKLPNGNYLSVGRRRYSRDQFIDLGYNVEGVDPDEVDVVVELDQTTGDIVWEWNIVDHVIQQRDPMVANYGILSENPQLLNMDAIARFDWTFQESFMINGMDYNPELDQIVLSVRKMSEIVIIDHSTTTKEAAGHSGGRYGKGGDILYRWGNPQNYDRGTADDRILYFQHNPNWIKEGEFTDQIICYNNGLSRPGFGYFDNYSTVPIIQTPIDEAGNYEIRDGDPFFPLQAAVEISEVHTNTPFYSGYTSGAQLLPNGNFYITEGVDGRIIEVNPAGELVWQYTVPFADFLFRSVKYPIDHPAFEGRDLAPDGLHPLDFSEYECELFELSNTQTLSNRPTAFEVGYYWSNRNLDIVNTFGNSYTIGVFNMQGQSVLQQYRSENANINLGDLVPGMYILRLEDQQSNSRFTKKLMVQ